MTDSRRWPESAEEKEARLRNEEAAQQANADLMRLARTEEGFRFLLGLLSRWGAESPVSEDVRSLTLRNEAEWLLDWLGGVEPAVCLRLVGLLRGLDT